MTTLRSIPRVVCISVIWDQSGPLSSSANDSASCAKRSSTQRPRSWMVSPRQAGVGVSWTMT
ncbi:MAG: hypothetical protein JO164_02975 [Candidatus Eremiobacteraeota bacterium]|nr:hypothetical protein [Candidatus Eremiobacteraeota bacterium]